MDRDFIASTNVRSIGYDPSTSTLEVEFNNSFVYQYYNVPLQVYEALMAAGSKGQFINSQIKNFYAFSRV